MSLGGVHGSPTVPRVVPALEVPCQYPSRRASHACRGSALSCEAMRAAIFHRAPLASTSASGPTRRSSSRPTRSCASCSPASAARTSGTTAASRRSRPARSATSSSASSRTSAPTSRDVAKGDLVVAPFTFSDGTLPALPARHHDRLHRTAASSRRTATAARARRSASRSPTARWSRCPAPGTPTRCCARC